MNYRIHSAKLCDYVQVEKVKSKELGYHNKARVLRLYLVLLH